MTNTWVHERSVTSTWVHERSVTSTWVHERNYTGDTLDTISNKFGEEIIRQQENIKINHVVTTQYLKNNPLLIANNIILYGWVGTYKPPCIIMYNCEE